MNAIEKTAEQWRAEFVAVRTGGVDRETGSIDASVELDAVARAVLGHVAEPGDGVLGRAIGAIGAARTAELLLQRATAGVLSGAVTEAGGHLDEREAGTGLDRWLPRLDHAAFVRSLTQAGRIGATFIVPGDSVWPARLDELGPHAPIGLWIRGRRDALAGDGSSIALVGARAATGYGEHVTMEASAGLVDRGFTIVSGGAYGIDGMAHRSALASRGVTVAFLAGGVDRFYPLGHETLLTRIAETGAVASELPCGAAPTKWRFLQRNRLIAAATDATVVLEAGMRSGSLNTAGHAAALGRPLGAVPGPVTSPASAGCHRLLREFDAVCVVDAEQMAELAGAGAAVRTHDDVRPRAADAPGAETAPESEVLRVTDALSTRTPRSIDEVARRSGMSVRDVMAVLGPLELHDVAVRHPDGWLRGRKR